LKKKGILFVDNNSNSTLILPFLEAAHNQMIPPPPSPRELFPALPPYSSSGVMGDTSYTD
jgi:hypothetical protein